MLPPHIMCRQHLLGEHVECHMFVGHLNAGKRLGQYVQLTEVHNIRERHDALVREMTRRGFNHMSPLPTFDERRQGRVNRTRSLRELLQRCPRCRARYIAALARYMRKVKR